MTFTGGIQPGQPYPQIAPERCVISGCAARSEHDAMLHARLLGGRSHPPVRTILRLGFCHLHAATSHDGLTVHQFQQPGSHALAEARLCSVHQCHQDAQSPAALQARLLGGYQYDPLDVTVELGLCDTHGENSHNGLQPGTFTPPPLGCLQPRIARRTGPKAIADAAGVVHCAA